MLHKNSLSSPFSAKSLILSFETEQERSTAEEANDLSSYVMQDSSEDPHPPSPLVGMYENEDASEHYWTLVWDASPCSASGGGCAVALLEGDYQRRIAVISVSGQPIPAPCTVQKAAHSVARNQSKAWSGCILAL